MEASQFVGIFDPPGTVRNNRAEQVTPFLPFNSTQHSMVVSALVVLREVQNKITEA